MSAKASTLLEDAGEYVPDARKHNAELVGKQGQDEISLADLWPEPNWKDMVAGGMPVDLAAAKFIAYSSIRNKPRAARVHDISGQAWLNAYSMAVKLLREIIETATAVEEIKNLNKILCAKAGIPFDRLRNLKVNEAIVFWAAGMGGERRLKSPSSGTTRLREMRLWLPKMGWPQSDAAWKTSIVPVRLTDNTWRVSRIEAETWVFLSDVKHVDEHDALAAAIEAAEAEYEEKQFETKLVPKRPMSGKDAARVGPDYRNGADITPEQLMEEFNLRAIQYGNSVTIPDRQKWINQTFDALADLADVLKMKRKWIGLPYSSRSLALAIGARGIGHASAHYEPDHKIINQTYRNGAGLLAHEYGHALDHRLGHTLGLAYYATKMGLFELNPYALKGEKADAIGERLLDIGIACAKGSQFRKQANIIGSTHRAGNYWAENEELFARSFEAFVQDSLIAMARSNPWLVHGTLEADYDFASVAACPYPVGDEREWLLDAHSLLVETMLAPA